jgi:3-hydroxymyristoyl/3-hydroxydecanoyl-(acyl carrier protein) dehydratase
MNFLFVDQLLSFELGQGACGIKHVTAYDTYLTPSAIGKPALLSCIVGEALGQLCTWYVIKATDAKFRSVAGIVAEVKMFGQAYLGDTIELNVQVEQLDEQAVNWHGEAKVRGQTILIVKNSVGPCLPMADFNDPEEVRRQLKMIDRPDNLPVHIEGQAVIPDHVNYYPELTCFDNILSWDKGKKIVAQKNISIIAPYFVDHFPRKPVLPITILLQTKLQLAQQFLIDLLGSEAAKHFYPSRVSNIKMKDFVLPGQTLETTLTVKASSENNFVFAFQSEINKKRICVAEAEFIRVC